MAGPTTLGRSSIHRPTAYDRFDNNKRNSWLDDIQARIQKGINPPVDAGPSRTPSPFEDEVAEATGLNLQDGLGDDDLEYDDVFGAPGEVDMQTTLDVQDGVAGVMQDGTDAFDSGRLARSIVPGDDVNVNTYLQGIIPQAAVPDAGLVQPSSTSIPPSILPTDFVPDTSAFDPALFDQYLSAPPDPSGAAPGLGAYTESDQAIAADFFQSLSQAAVASGVAFDMYGENTAASIPAGPSGEYQFALTGTTEPYILSEDEGNTGVAQYAVPGEDAAMADMSGEAVESPWDAAPLASDAPFASEAVDGREPSVELAGEYDVYDGASEHSAQDFDEEGGEEEEEEGEEEEEIAYSRNHSDADDGGAADDEEEDEASGQYRPRQSRHQRFDSAEDSEEEEEYDSEGNYDATASRTGGRGEAGPFVDQEAELEEDELDGSDGEQSDEDEEDDEEVEKPSTKRKLGADEDQPIEISDDEDEDASTAPAGSSSRPTNRPRRSDTPETEGGDEHDEERREEYEGEPSDEEEEQDEPAAGAVDHDDSFSGSSRDSSSDEEAENPPNPGSRPSASPYDMDDDVHNSASPVPQTSDIPDAVQSARDVPPLDAAPSSPQSSMGRRSPSPPRRSSPPSVDSDPIASASQTRASASPSQREPIIIDVTDSEDDSDAQSADQEQEEYLRPAERSDRDDDSQSDEEQEDNDDDEEEEELPMPPARQTPRSEAVLDLTGSEESESEEGDERVPSQSGRSLYVPFQPGTGSPRATDDVAMGSALGEDDGEDDDGDEGSDSGEEGSGDDSVDEQNQFMSDGEDKQEEDGAEDNLVDSGDDQRTSAHKHTNQSGEAGLARPSQLPMPDGLVESGDPVFAADAFADNVTGSAEEVHATSAAETVYDVTDSEDSVAEDVDMESGASPVVVQSIDGDVEVSPLDDITAAAVNVATSLLPDVIETPGVEQPAAMRFDVGLETITELIPESSAAPSPSGENTPLFDAPAESPAILEETPVVRTIDIPEHTDPVEAATEMIGQPDAIIEHHAPRTDASSVPTAAGYEPLISIPTAEEEEEQVEATSGMEVEEPITDAEVAHTDMVDQPDVEIIHHAPHVDDVLHAPATSTHSMLSMPTDAEEEEQLVANAGEDLGHHAAIVEPRAHLEATKVTQTFAEEAEIDTSMSAVGPARPTESPSPKPAVEVAEMEVDTAIPETIELPDPMAAPPATDLELPLEAGDMATRSRSPSMEVAPPAHPPVITFTSRPPSREDSPIFMPDPQAPPPDAHIPSPLRAGDMPLQEDHSPSIDVQAPEEEPPLTTPIEGGLSGSPSHELPDPTAPAADAWLPMPDVPVADQPSSPSVVVQAPDEANADALGAAGEDFGEREAGSEDLDEDKNDIGENAEAGSLAPVARDFAHELVMPEIVTIPDTPASERDIDLALATTRETTPYAPLRHQHGGLAPSPRRARRSVTPAGDAPTTRSHCDYHKIRLTSDGQIGTFLVPQCILGDVERVTAEGVEDLGKASEAEEKAGKKNAVHHGHQDLSAEVAAKLHRIAGAGIFDEGHLYLLEVAQLQADEDEEGEEAIPGEDEQAQAEADDDIQIDIEAVPASNTRAKTASVEPDQIGEEAEVDYGDIEETPAGNTRSKPASVEPGLSMSGLEESASAEEQEAGSERDEVEDSSDNEGASNEIVAAPAGNTRSKTASVEPGLGEVAARTRESTVSVGTVPGDEHDEKGTLRRSSRLSKSVEPAETHSQANRHRRTRSAARAEETIASGGMAMARTASATSQATIPEETQADQPRSKAKVRARRSTRLNPGISQEDEEESQPAAEEVTEPRTPAHAKPQSKGTASGRKVSTRTRQDEAPYRPVTPEADPEVESEAETDTPSRRKAGNSTRSTRKASQRRTPVVEILTGSSNAQASAQPEAGSEGGDAKESPMATRTRKRKYRLSTAGDEEAEESGEETATPSKSKRRAVSKGEEAETGTEKRVTRSGASGTKEEQPAKRGFFGSLGKLFGGRK